MFIAQRTKNNKNTESTKRSIRRALITSKALINGEIYFKREVNEIMIEVQNSCYNNTKYHSLCLVDN